MSTVIVYCPYSGMYSEVEEASIANRLNVFKKLKKARHHKCVTINDLLKIFGFDETDAGDYFEVDEFFGLQKMTYAANGGKEGTRYIMEYSHRPIYEIEL